MAIVAQNAKLTINLPAGIEPVRVYGSEEPLNRDKLELPLGDLASGEERVLLMKFRVRSTNGNDVTKLRALLSYDDLAGAQRRAQEQEIRIEQAATDGSREQSLAAYARLVEAVDQISLAVQGMDRRLAAAALSFRREEYPELKRTALASGDQDFVNKSFMFEHFARELAGLIERGALHEHSRERKRLQKELHFRRHLMNHHRHHH